MTTALGLRAPRHVALVHRRGRGAGARRARAALRARARRVTSSSCSRSLSRRTRRSSEPLSRTRTAPTCTSRHTSGSASTAAMGSSRRSAPPSLTRTWRAYDAGVHARGHARRRPLRRAALEQVPRALRQRGSRPEDADHDGGDRGTQGDAPARRLSRGLRQHDRLLPCPVPPRLRRRDHRRARELRVRSVRRAARSLDFVRIARHESRTSPKSRAALS